MAFACRFTLNYGKLFLMTALVCLVAGLYLSREYKVYQHIRAMPYHDTEEAADLADLPSIQLAAH